MSKKKRSAPQKPQKRNAQVGVFLRNDSWDSICSLGYTSLDHNPEIMTACRRIAELIGSMTIYLMANTKDGDIRVTNELSRRIDIEPELHMTRSTWMQAIVMNLLLYGKGNSVVVPHTWEGLIQSLEPITASRVQFMPEGYRDYKIQIDGTVRDPDSLLHFVFNPDPTYLWKGRGLQIVLRDLANNLKQAAETEKGFMQSKWKPSVIVKVDALTEEFADPAGRKKLLDDYVQGSEAGEPWLIPAEQFQVEQIRPLSLADLAINDTVTLDKKTVAAVLGVPPFVLGVGEYSQTAWNAFVQNTIRPIALSIQQELTRKLILSPKMYIKFNTLSLLDWSLENIYTVFGGLYDKGIVDGNEVRDRIGMDPRDGLSDLKVLENYIPIDRIGDQKKLVGNE